MFEVGVDVEGHGGTGVDQDLGAEERGEGAHGGGVAGEGAQEDAQFRAVDAERPGCVVLERAWCVAVFAGQGHPELDAVEDGGAGGGDLRVADAVATRNVQICSPCSGPAAVRVSFTWRYGRPGVPAIRGAACASCRRADPCEPSAIARHGAPGGSEGSRTCGHAERARACADGKQVPCASWAGSPGSAPDDWYEGCHRGEVNASLQGRDHNMCTGPWGVKGVVSVPGCDDPVQDRGGVGFGGMVGGRAGLGDAAVAPKPRRWPRHRHTRSRKWCAPPPIPHHPASPMASPPLFPRRLRRGTTTALSRLKSGTAAPHKVLPHLKNGRGSTLRACRAYCERSIRT